MSVKFDIIALTFKRRYNIPINTKPLYKHTAVFAVLNIAYSVLASKLPNPLIRLFCFIFFIYFQQVIIT